MNRQSEKMLEIALSHLSHVTEIDDKSESAIINAIKKIKEGKVKVEAPKKNEKKEDAADVAKEEKN